MGWKHVRSGASVAAEKASRARHAIKRTSKIMSICQATWEDAGRLSMLETDFSGGVYLFIHEGPPRRVVYVGTAQQVSGFTRRWCEHLRLFKTGGRTLWRPKDTTDVYSLMTLEPPAYEACCRDALVWMPSGKRVHGTYQPYYEISPTYEDAWQKWVLSAYLPQIAVWRCRLLDGEHALILESQIQLSFRSQFKIGYYRKLGVQSWLGHVHVSDAARRSSLRFAFETLPELEPDSRELLAHLPA